MKKRANSGDVIELSSSTTSAIPTPNKKLKHEPHVSLNSIAVSNNNENIAEKLLKPVDKPGVVRVLDRRINSYVFGESASLYSLLRAWVHDDPEKTSVETTSGSSPNQVSSSTYPSVTNQNQSQNDYDEIISYLESKLKEKRCSSWSEFQASINNLEGISPADILSLHTIYYKRVKQIWKMLYAAKYGRFRQTQMNDNQKINSFPMVQNLERYLLHNNPPSLSSSVPSLNQQQQTQHDQSTGAASTTASSIEFNSLLHIHNELKKRKLSVTIPSLSRTTSNSSSSSSSL